VLLAVVTYGIGRGEDREEMVVQFCGGRGGNAAGARQGWCPFLVDEAVGARESSGANTARRWSVIASSPFSVKPHEHCTSVMVTFLSIVAAAIAHSLSLLRWRGGGKSGGGWSGDAADCAPRGHQSRKR
jgi:hypothetical protein